MEEFEIDQGTGKNLRTVISKELVKSPIVAVKELVSNSYDANAENVIIEVDEKSHTLLVEDDGLGMNEAGLVGFLRMGDSEKIGKPKTPKPKERDCIGQFGIATVLVQYLGNSYNLDTWKGDSHVSGTEIFSGTPGLEYVVERNPSGKQGTRILIRGVDALGTDIFSIKKLEQALTWEVPNTEDLAKGDIFDIILNGEKLVRKNSKPQQEFEFEEVLETSGKVHMHLEYFTSRPKIGGVYVYVSGRSVGDKGDFNLHKVSRGISGKVFAKVIANGLKPHISFDRDHFRADNNAFEEVRKWVYANLRKVKRSVEVEAPKSRYKSIPTEDIVKETFKDTSFSVDSSANNKNEKPGKKGKAKELVASKPTFTTHFPVQVQEGGERPKLQSRSNQGQGSRALIGLHTIMEGILSPQARLDFQTRELTFNISHPWYKSSETANNDVMKMHVLLGGCYGLADGFYLEIGGSERYVEGFNDLCARVLSQESVLENIRLRISQKSDSEVFIPFKKYSPGEIFSKMDISESTLVKLVNAGVLDSSSNRIKGSELNSCIQKMTNYTPASKVMEELGREREVTRQRIDQLSKGIDETLTIYTDLLPFLYNIGVLKPFFLIPDEQVQMFKGLYNQKAIKRTQNISTHAERYQHLFDRAVNSKGETEFLGLEGLCTSIKGTPAEVFRIVSFAQRRGVEMPFKIKDEAVHYSAPHFKKAREKYLANGEK